MFVKGLNTQKELHYELINSEGRLLKSAQLGQEHRIEIKELLPAMYILSVLDDKGKELVSRRFVKE